MVKKRDVKAALMQRFKEKGLLPSVDYMLLRDVFHSGKTHACVKRGARIWQGKVKA